MVTRTVELPDELHRQITELARQSGRAETDLLHEAIAIYVQTHRAPVPKSDGAIEDVVLAARDVDEWLTANWRPV
jgi:predicted transcriptional regulator